MYIQCKVYLQLCRKWKAYNRTIVVQVIFYKIYSDVYYGSFSKCWLLLADQGLKARMLGHHWIDIMGGWWTVT